MRQTTTTLFTFLILSFFSIVQAQNVYQFTNAGATGKDGPSQSQLNTAYASTTLSGAVISSAGIQRWIVPSSGAYSIQANGAQGGGANGGLGASMLGEFNLLAGDTLFILVGQEGESSGTNQLAGGGGSYVVQGATNNILVIAGGGGGAATTGTLSGGTTVQNGQDADGASQGLGGTSGAGGTGASCRGGGGAGWLTVGGIGGCGTTGTGQGGIPFSQGGEGGGYTSSLGAEGGFGGGGSTEGINTSWSYCGGGGGYSGGGGSSGTNTSFRGGGGGSINNGINQVNTSSSQSGDGSVIISSLTPPAPNNVGLNSFINPQTVNGAVCAGSASVDVVVQNYGSNQVSSLTIDWTLNGVLQTPISYSSLLDTFGGAGNMADTVNLGTVNIQSNTDLIAWTSLPNGVIDTTVSNDTAYVAVDSVVNIALDLGPDTIICSGNGLFLQNSGSSQVFSNYNWSTGSGQSSILVSTPGIYSVTVTYGPPQCIASDTIELIAGTNPVVDLGADFEQCGDTIIDAQNAGFDFSWSTGDNTQTILIDTTGFYNVTVTSFDGCSSSDEIYAVINPLPEVDLGDDFEICIDKNEATGIGISSDPTYTYEWNTGSSNNLIIVGAVGSPLGNNVFWLTVTDDNGCVGSDTLNILFKNCLVGVNSIDQNIAWKVYPVPTSDFVNFLIGENATEASIDVYDVNGRLVQNLFSGSLTLNQLLTYDVSNLSSGVYVVRLTSDKNTAVKQIVID